MKVTRELRTARQVMSPIECRGFVAQWDTRLSQLMLHGATQFPHVVRTGLAQFLGVDVVENEKIIRQSLKLRAHFVFPESALPPRHAIGFMLFRSPICKKGQSRVA